VSDYTACTKICDKTGNVRYGNHCYLEIIHEYLDHREFDGRREKMPFLTAAVYL
jgi:hypothetical protein